MKIRRSVLIGAATGALLVSALALPANAVTDDAATALIDAALGTEDVTVTDPALQQELIEQVQEAADLGVLDPTIVDRVSTDPTATPSAAIDALISDHEAAQLTNWNSVGAQIQAAFAVVRAEFEQCRQAGDVSTCAKSLGASYQAALAQVKQEQVAVGSEGAANTAETPGATGSGTTQMQGNSGSGDASNKSNGNSSTNDSSTKSNGNSNSNSGSKSNGNSNIKSNGKN